MTTPMTIVAPSSPDSERPRPQHLTALERANAIRLQQAMAKRWIAEPGVMAASRARAAKLIQRPGDAAFLGELGAEAVSRMTVDVVLGACTRTGPMTIRKLLRRLDIYERKVVGQLTPRQADRLAGALVGGITEQLELGVGS